jgi:hypothetical protein
MLKKKKKKKKKTVVFDYERYYGMWYIWTLWKGFLFYGLCGVSQHSTYT